MPKEEGQRGGGCNDEEGPPNGWRGLVACGRTIGFDLIIRGQLFLDSIGNKEDGTQLCFMQD